MLKLIPILIAIALMHIPNMAQAADEPPHSRGAYLAALGDCTSCHTVPGHPAFIGGYPLQSPFGTIYSTNITPDPDVGIGRYTLKDFMRAIREGIAKDGHHLYPAMPYPSFSKMSDEDVKDLYDYFMHEVEPRHEEMTKTNLSFPFNQRWTITFWNLAFAEDKRFKPNKHRDETWNRGAYLVQSVGHCGACHTPRGLAYEEEATNESSQAFLRGEVLDNWSASNLTGDKPSGLGSWSENDIENFLEKGEGAGVAAFGNMQPVIEHSGQFMTPDDRHAIAVYLKSLRAYGERASYLQDQAQQKPAFERPGAGIYAYACSGCHQPDGSGRLPQIPKLAGNSTVLSANTTSLIRIVLEGGGTPETRNGPNPVKMPGFGKKFTNQEIADVVTFIRRSWGNNAAAAGAADVAGLRKKLDAKPPQ